VLREIVQIGDQDRRIDQLAVASMHLPAQNPLTDAMAEIGVRYSLKRLARGMAL
jgi:hypothetical protein